MSESGAGASTLQAALTNLRQTDSKDSSGFVNPEQRYLFTSLRGQQKHNSFECFLRSALRVADSGGVTAGGQEVTLRDNQNQRIAIERLKLVGMSMMFVLYWTLMFVVVVAVDGIRIMLICCYGNSYGMSVFRRNGLMLCMILRI